MDVREKLVEMSDIQVLQREIECVKRKSATNCADCLNCDLLMTDERILSAYANAIDALQNANSVTVQEWISVDDRLPTIYDADDDNCVFAIHKTTNKRYYHWRSVADNPFDFTYWTRTPHPPKGE